MSQDQDKNIVDVEDLVDTPMQEATKSKVVTSSTDAGALVLARASTVSEMKSEMC